MAALCSAVLLPPGAEAQTAGTRRVRRGEISGVELGLSGAMNAPRGGHLRWAVQAYEVLGLQRLRPAPGATVELTTSLDPSAEPTRLQVDAYGRGVVELAIPADAPPSFRAVLVLESASQVRRRFELTVGTEMARQLELWASRDQVPRAGTLRVFGRLSRRTDHHGLAEEVVTVRAFDARGGAIGAPVELRTDVAGLYAHELRLPRDVEGAVRVRATSGEREARLTAEASARVVEPQPAEMIVAAAPSEVLLRPGDRVDVQVVVRTGEGRPIPGALVRLENNPVRRGDLPIETDARGRATLSWQSPTSAGAFQDVTLRVTALKEGIGGASASTLVRVAGRDYAASMAIEGGALVPELGGRVYVRVVGADGQAARQGVRVAASGPRVPGGLSATTDADGLAVLDLRPEALANGEADRCGGESATAIDLTIGDGARAGSLSSCVLLDPDGAARVRLSSPLAAPGDRVQVQVDRVAAASTLPVAVTAYARTEGAPHVAIASLLLPRGQSGGALALPQDVVGTVHIYARPLVGAEQQPVRGGATSLLVLPGGRHDVTLRVEDSGEAALTFQGGEQEPRSLYLIALPLEEAASLGQRIRPTLSGLIDRDRHPEGRIGAAFIEASLAARAGLDIGAPAVLRGRDAVPVPAPEDPLAVGLLRDPWRTRARFVTGRLALIFAAIEARIASSVPERLDDVAVQTNGRFEFNAQVLEAVASSASVGSAGAVGMGGEPLTIDALRSFDSSFTYDNVARRITRRRLFRLLVALRHFVRDNQFDLPWSRLGEPSTWLRTLPNQYFQNVGHIDRRELVDGWGRPFELRRSASGRSRFTFLDPLGGWDLISAGPDGRFGTGDDLWDPTARVLPSGSSYAEAVGEDLLVARLQGLELGRASMDLMRNSVPGLGGRYIQVPHPGSHGAARVGDWNALPSVRRADRDALALRRPGHPGEGFGRLRQLPPSGGRIPITLDEEPRTWGFLAFAATPSGMIAVDEASAIGGSPLIVEGALPSHLREGEEVAIDLHVTNILPSDRGLRFEVEADDGVAVQAPGAQRIGGERSERISYVLRGQHPGRAPVTLRFVAEDGRALRTLRFRPRVVAGRHPLRVRAAGVASEEQAFLTRLTLPEDAAEPSGRILLLGHDGFAGDPDLADLRRADPALVAWSNALAGRASDPRLWADLLRAQDPSGFVQGTPGLSTACAAVAWGTAGEDDQDAREALSRVQNALRGQSVGGQGLSPEEVRLGASVLAAVSPGGVPEAWTQQLAVRDPVAALTTQIRAGLRRALRNLPEEPSLLARASAALLLADPRDLYGRAMFDRARQHLREDDGGAMVVVPSEDQAGVVEERAASAAMAIAAHQLGHRRLALALARGALARDHVLLSSGGEAAFWVLALGAYGVLGTEAPSRITVRINGEAQEVQLTEGRAVLPLSGLRAGARSEVRVEAAGGAVFARVEAVLGRPFAARSEGPLALALQGDPGHLDELAALELSVRATAEVRAPVVELQLPSGVEVTDDLLAAVRRSGTVREAEAREPGFLRLRLDDMAAGTEVALALPLRWTARGRLTGLAAVAYPADQPGRMTVLPARALRIAPAESGAEGVAQ